MSMIRSKIFSFAILWTFSICCAPSLSHASDSSPSPEKIKAQLHKHCANCIDPSLPQFLTTVEQLEAVFSISELDSSLQPYQLLLIKAYEHLMFKYHKDDKLLQRAIAMKQLELLEKFEPYTMISAREELFFDLDIYHVMKVRKIFEHDSELKKSTMLRFEAVKHKIFNKPEFATPSFLSSALELKPQEIISLINILTNIESTPKRGKETRLIERSETLLLLIQNNKVPQDQLVNLKRAAISALSSRITKDKHILEDIIWWATVRMIDDTQALKSFLNTQLDTTRKVEANDLLTSLGVTN